MARYILLKITFALLPCQAWAFSQHYKSIFLRSAKATGGVTKRESLQTRRSTATYQDEAYEMFLSNIEKEMVDSWNTMEMTVGDEIPRFGLDSAYMYEEVNTETDDDDGIATLELECDGANSEEFLLSLSRIKLQERLREAGLSIQGQDKVELVRRLIGKDKKGESGT
eukprot:CAMPEP_0197715036 /NCGR_PEP_ID=MMETSP1434-20131217/188_1 /TAXON_ID=265543 /ORGANISM="Minutocellus polymorphus, Strain CCMP3303" /LENGTH=167 /DNA_ID=CAMNT_0043299019 /DNA_START=99 /DNA_END=602 /DNA_ORIENTATION=+